MSALLPIDDTEFETKVLNSQGLVAVDFWAPWCGPCRMVHPILEEISEENDNLIIYALNIDENTETAISYQVMSIPTLLIFRDGKLVSKIVGAHSKRDYLAAFN